MHRASLIRLQLQIAIRRTEQNRLDQALHTGRNNFIDARIVVEASATRSQRESIGTFAHGRIDCVVEDDRSPDRSRSTHRQNQRQQWTGAAVLAAFPIRRWS